MSTSRIPPLTSAIAPDQVQLATLEAAFTATTDRKIGVEIELTIVDAKTNAPLPLYQHVRDSLPNDTVKQIADGHLRCQIEIVSTPCESLRELREQMQRLIKEVERAASKLGAKLLWSGMHPNLDRSESLVTDSARSLHNRHRYGDLTRQISTCGVHLHIGVTHDEAIKVIDRLQAYLPLLTALASNSPISENRRTGRRSQRAAIWSSGFPVCGLSGPFGDWATFNHRVAQLQIAKRVESAKDLYDFARPTRFSTVEVRCCDTPVDLDQVIALAGVAQALVESLARGENVIERDRDFLQAELHEAAMRGPEASLTDARGDLVSPMQFLSRIVYDLQPIACELGSDLFLRMAPAVLSDNGSTRQLQAFERQQEAIEKNVRAQSAPLQRAGWQSEIALATAASLLLASGLFAWTASIAG